MVMDDWMVVAVVVLQVEVATVVSVMTVVTMVATGHTLLVYVNVIIVAGYIDIVMTVVVVAVGLGLRRTTMEMSVVAVAGDVSCPVSSVVVLDVNVVIITLDPDAVSPVASRRRRLVTDPDAAEPKKRVQRIPSL